MPQNIRLRRTTSNTAPALLSQGEPSVELGPITRVWLGDGTVNRLLLSSDPADPALGVTGYLRLTGGTMAGQIETIPPVAANDATNKQYVDALVANLRLFHGTWAVATNTPDLTAGTHTPGDYYIAVTVNANVPENPPALPVIPGLPSATTEIHNGDLVLWNDGLGVWELVRGGPLTTTEADSFYIQKIGDAMTGDLTLAGDPTLPVHAANKNYVDGLVAQYLPLAGGVLTGFLTLNADPTANNHAATKAYVDTNGFTGVTIAAVDPGLTGNGTAGSPLAVDMVDGGTY